jgi:hypothetical protein
MYVFAELVGLLHSTNADKKSTKTYNSWDSLMVTHLTTSQPVRCLNRAERTGSLVFNVLWSYVEILLDYEQYILLKLVWESLWFCELMWNSEFCLCLHR